jgi:glyoxylase-like metal-dependent hydrolase (beta-lactamase superfamily II)
VLAELLADLAAGAQTPAAAAARLDTDQLRPLIVGLAGQDQAAGGLRLDFTQSQTCQIRIADLAGRDPITLSFSQALEAATYAVSGLPNPYRGGAGSSIPVSGNGMLSVNGQHGVTLLPVRAGAVATTESTRARCWSCSCATPQTIPQESGMRNIVNVGYDSTNYYVIETATTKLLVDVGFPGTLPKLRHALQRTGIPLTSIAYLLVTHYHPDHAGLAQEVKQQGARLIVLDHQVAAIPALQRYMKPEYHYRAITLDDNVTISPAQSRAFLRKIGIDGEIIATPGHSDDSVTLILDAGMAFTGDLPPPHMAADDSSVLADSWAQIRARKVQTIYPGHGPVHPLSTEGHHQ